MNLCFSCSTSDTPIICFKCLIKTTGVFFIDFITSSSAVSPPAAPFSQEGKSTVCRVWYHFSDRRTCSSGLLCDIKQLRDRRDHTEQFIVQITSVHLLDRDLLISICYEHAAHLWKERALHSRNWGKLLDSKRQHMNMNTFYSALLSLTNVSPVKSQKKEKKKNK